MVSNPKVFRPQKFITHVPSTEQEVEQASTGIRGPVGPEGPPGPPGEDAGTHLHIQSVSSTSWLMNHNLGFKPNVDAFDETGRRIRAAVIHHTDNQTEVQFLTPRTGSANLS